MDFLIIVGLMVGFLYFMMIRPQQRRQRAHQELLRSLQPGDMVVTNAGIHGAVALVDNDQRVVWLEVAPEVELKVSRSAIFERTDPVADDDLDDDADIEDDIEDELDEETP